MFPSFVFLLFQLPKSAESFFLKLFVLFLSLLVNYAHHLLVSLHPHTHFHSPFLHLVLMESLQHLHHLCHLENTRHRNVNPFHAEANFVREKKMQKVLKNIWTLSCWYHGLSQQGVWVSFWTPKPLKSTHQDTQNSFERNFLKCQSQAYHYIRISCLTLINIYMFMVEIWGYCGPP